MYISSSSSLLLLLLLLSSSSHADSVDCLNSLSLTLFQDGIQLREGNKKQKLR